MSSIRKWFLAIAAAGLAVRLGIALVGNPPLYSDSLEYQQYAVNLVKDHQYYIIYEGRQKAIEGQKLYSYRSPGYPFFLALNYELFGIHFKPVLVVQALLDLLSGVFLFFIARNWLSEKYSLLAFAGMMVNVIWVPMIMTEVFSLFLFLFCFWIIAGKRRESLFWMSLAGIGYGWLMLTRPEKVVFVPVFSLYLLWKDHSRKNMARILAWGLVMLAVISPWLWREYRVHGRFVWMATMGGRTFFDGSHMPYSPRLIYQKTTEAGLEEAETDQIFFKMTFQYLKEHPGHYLRSGVQRVRKLWSLGNANVLVSQFLNPLLEAGGRLRGVTALIGYYLFLVSRAVMVLGLLGALFYLRKFKELFLIYSVPLFLTLFHFIIFIGLPRYLIYAYPCLCIFSALWIRWLLIKLGLEKDEKNDLAMGACVPNP
jgi:4-amino-4-deoxy-L-arabinose transferase-like glycosyltransferase